MSDNRPIGVCDSGVGGLTILKEIQRVLPNESLVYFGDTARTPYGTRSKERIIEFSIEDVSFLLQKRVKFIMVACNTMSALALEELRERFDTPILGVLKAGVRAAVEKSNGGTIGVIGTEATIGSGSYQKEIQKIDSRVKVESQACPLLVPLVEEGWLDTEVTMMVLKKYLRPLMRKQIAVLLLGCTHYPLLKRQFCELLGDRTTVVDPGEEVALELKDQLSVLGLAASPTAQPKYSFFVSDFPKKFDRLSKLFLNSQKITSEKTVIPLKEDLR